MNSLIGKRVTITSKEHQDCGNWGVVKSFDGDQYHIAMNAGNTVLVFDRDEFRVSRQQGEPK